jgi:hypothetical protein
MENLILISGKRLPFQAAQTLVMLNNTDGL